MASAAVALLQSSASLVSCCPCTKSRFPQKATFASPCSSFLQSAAPFDTTFSRKGGDKRLGRTRCQASDGASVEQGVRRRDICVGGLGAALLASVQSVEVANARDAELGALYPTAPDPAYVVFKPTPNQTPALRAGNLSPYEFWIPPTWKEARVANILSGNYCQPKCAEPWVEAKFENPKQGNIQVIISPLVRLTNSPGAPIEKIGSADAIITSLGQFVTGNSIEPDEIVEVDSKTNGGRTYYTYTVDSPYAKNGTHNLAVATAKDNAVYLFVVSSNDKQWVANEKLLRTVQQSFKV